MGKVIEMTTADEEQFEIGRDDEFYVAAKELSEVIKALPIDTKTNDGLIRLIIEQVKAAEKSAFFRGVRFGMAASKISEKSPDERS